MSNFVSAVWWGALVAPERKEAEWSIALDFDFVSTATTSAERDPFFRVPKFGFLLFWGITIAAGVEAPTTFTNGIEVADFGATADRTVFIDGFWIAGPAQGCLDQCLFPQLGHLGASMRIV